MSSGNGVSTSTYTYDNANRLTSETQTSSASFTVGYTYDADGNRTSTTYPSSTVVGYGYTGRNQINAISVGGASIATFSHDGNGNVTSKALGNGTQATYTYDNANRLLTLNHTHGGSSLARFDYGYDPANRRTFEQRDSAKGDIYTYDAIDQLTTIAYEATNPGSSLSGLDRYVGYYYDAAGNRNYIYDSNVGYVGYIANTLNQYTATAGISLGYDGNGNLVSGNGLYLYDAQNRLFSAHVGSNVETFAYDSKNRVSYRTLNGTTMYYIYDGWDLIEERNSAGTVLATYVHGPRSDEMISKITPTNTVYYHENANGNVADLTDGTGTVVEKYKYDAFGKPAITDGSGSPLTVSAYGNRFLFTGREYLAEISLYDYRNRVYSADLGRFLQTDPLRFNAGDVNIYRYVGNDSVNAIDPSGALLVDSSGNLIVTPNGQTGTTAAGNTLTGYTAYTNQGNPINVFQGDDPDSDDNTDCHGSTFTNGQFWINNNQVQQILNDDGWTPTNAPQTGDIGILSDNNNNIEHSVTVETSSGDDSGDNVDNDPTVYSKGGVTSPESTSINQVQNQFHGTTTQYYTGGGNRTVH